ncbi:MAG TPA: amino acid adenylation domain-containing protein, partial [Longimicrobiaceae bacterium]
VLLGAFQVLLARYGSTDDVVVGTTVAGRMRAEVEPLIGLFMNTLVLRTDLSGDPTFREVLRRVREVTLGAYDHGEVPFEKLVEELRPERDLSHAPLFQVLVELHDTLGTAAAVLPGIEVRGVPMDTGTAKFDLTLSAAATADGLTGWLEYSTDLFERGTVQRMIGHLERVLEQVAAHADRRISALELLGGAERHLLLVDLNRSEAPFPAGVCIHQLFEAQARRTPDAVAVTCERESLTYRELDARANRIARHLRRLGVGPEVRVAIGVERGIEMIASLMAVLKAGGAYVPLDPAYPAERLAFTLRDAAAQVLVTQEKLRGLLPVPGGVTVVSLDAAAEEIARESAEPLPCTAAPENLAYLIYTSGSTGVPKGVAIEHRSAVVLLAWGAGVHTDDELAGMLAATSICFDMSVFEIFLPLARGGRVIVVENALALPRSAAAGEVRLIDTVPSAIDALLKNGGIPAGVRTVILGGELLRPELVDALHARGIERVFDGYGPSEDTTFSTFALRLPGAAPTIGRPISNTQAYILDAAMRPVPLGAAGELWLGGRGLARGYLGRPALTAERFTPNPFAATPGERLYRTGDRVRWRADGTLEYLGRLDHQVKVRGFRVEPGEVAAALRRHPAVREAVVVAREDAPGERRLVAYLVGQADADVLRAHLKETLPEYMVPSAFVAMEALPLTPNGKLDRAALPAPDLSSAAERYVAPRTPAEKVLAAIWAAVLQVERVGVHDGFFDLGGHSLLATRMLSRVREVFGVEPTVRAVFEGPTVADLARTIEAMRHAGQPEHREIVPVPRTGALPLSFAQERLWFLDRLEPGSAFYNYAPRL